jgi:hypothetical protein
MKKYLIIILGLFPILLFSQFGILNRVANRIENRLEDKLIDALADEIYKKAFRPVDLAIEDAVRKSIDSTGMTYDEYLKSMNIAYDRLPAQYSFDLMCDIKMIDDKKKSNFAKQYFTKQGDAIAYETIEKNERNIIIYDIKNDMMILLKEEKGKKSGQVVPSIGRLTAAIVSPQMEEKMKKIKVTKTGGTATIAGYNTDEFLMKDETNYESKIYISTTFLVYYTAAYGKFFKSLVPATYSELQGLPNGFCLKSESIDTKKNSISTYEIENVNTGTFGFSKTDYNFNK